MVMRLFSFKLYDYTLFRRKFTSYMKKDVNHFVVYAVNHIVMDELQELSHLVSPYLHVPLDTATTSDLLQP